MPFKIIKVGKYWKVFKLKENIFVKTNFKTKKSAIRQALNWLRYRNEI